MFNVESVLGKSELNHCVAIYVPATINVSENIDNSDYVDKCATFLSSIFGGATALDTRGFWISDVGLVREKSTKVYAFCAESDLELFISDIVLYCRELRDEMTQECVSLEVDGKLYFV